MNNLEQIKEAIAILNNAPKPDYQLDVILEESREFVESLEKDDEQV